MGTISPKLLTRKPQEVGKIKIGRLGGEKRTSSGNTMRMPEKLDHFVVTTRERKNGNLVRDDAFHQRLGEQAPKTLRGILMFETPEENFHSELCIYKGKTRVFTCDGEVGTNLESGETAPCRKAAGKSCKCKPYGRLPLQLDHAETVLGFHLFRTTSWESIGNILSGLEGIYDLFGTCYHCPVLLSVYPSEDRYGDGKTGTSWKVSLTPAVSVEELGRIMVEERRRLEQSRHELRLLSGQVRQDLDRSDEADGEHLVNEYVLDPSLGRDSVEASIGTRERMDELREQAGLDVELAGEEDGEPVEAEAIPPGDPVPSRPQPIRATPTPAELSDLQSMLETLEGDERLSPTQWSVAHDTLHSRNGPGVRMWIAELRNILDSSPPSSAQGDLLGG